MTDLNPIWYAAYFGLIVGAPVVFFHFVNKKRQDDLNEVVSYIESQVQKERTDEVTSYASDLKRINDEMKRLEGLVKQKDSVIKEKDAELEKIKPLLKYLRPPPSDGAAL